MKIFKNKYMVVFMLGTLYLTTRFLILLTMKNVDENEILQIGAVSKEIIMGAKWSLFDYQRVTHYGGALVMSLVQAVLFKIFGDSIYVTMSSSFITFGLGSLIIFYLFLERYFNKKIAFIASIYFIFSPTAFALFSIHSLGIYMESIFFIFSSFYIYYLIYFSNKTDSVISRSNKNNIETNNALWAALGFINGFYLYFHHSAIFLIGVLILFMWVNDKKIFFKKHFGIYCVCFLIGFLPGILYNIMTHLSGLYKKDTLIWNLLIFNPIHSIKTLFSFANMPNYFFVTDIKYIVQGERSGVIFHDVFGYYYALVILGVLVYLLCIIASKSKNCLPVQNNRLSILLVYFIVYIFGFTFYDFPHIYFKRSLYNNFTPLYPFMCIFLSVSLCALDDVLRKVNKVMHLLLTYGICISMLLVGIISISNMIAFDDFNTLGQKYSQGYSYTYLTKYDYKNDILAVDKKIELSNKIDIVHRRFVYEALGYRLAMQYPTHQERDLLYKIQKPYKKYFDIYFAFKRCEVFNDETIYAMLSHINSEDLPFIYEGIGMYHFRTNTDFRGLLSDLSNKYIKYYYVGKGRAAGLYMIRNGDYKNEDILNIAQETDEDIEKYYYEGIGASFGLVDYGPQYSYFSKVFQNIPSANMPSYFIGVGRGAFEKYQYESFDYFLKIASCIDIQYQQYFFRGMGIGIAEVFSKDDYLKQKNNFIMVDQPVGFYIHQGAMEIWREREMSAI